MTRKNSIKINQLLKTLPRESLLTGPWLCTQGISTKLAWWYVQSGWLERLASKAYKFSGAPITWASAVNALQVQLQLPIHVGGKTALQLLGQSHYLPLQFSEQNLQLFTTPGMRIPPWLKKVIKPSLFTVFNTHLFNNTGHKSLGLVNKNYNQLAIELSTPERAALEVCYLVPKAIRFEEATQLIEGLSRLRPERVKLLLENCQSIKTKRLFLLLSEFYQHRWLKKVHLKNVVLGTGKQVVAGGGQYHAKYQLSTPRLRNA